MYYGADDIGSWQHIHWLAQYSPLPSASNRCSCHLLALVIG